MEIYNHTKMYCVYAIKSSDGLIYIGSTSNITNRLRHHISTHKNNKSTCSSKIILEKGNYFVSILRKDILTKEAAKQAEYNFIKGYGADCVNKNTPVLVDFKQYQREYQANLRKKKRLLSEQESTEQESTEQN
jgi:predicted GIY-YIG superfamily endonuclease